MQGEFVLVGVTVPKPYSISGNTGVSRKISIRTADGAVVSVRANTEFDFDQYLDRKVTIDFEVKQDGVLRAVSVVD